LLFNIYILNFGKEYYSTTIPEKLQNEIKSNIQAKGNKDAIEQKRIEEFFYSLEYRQLVEILFAKNWTNVEDKIQKEILQYEQEIIIDENIKKRIAQMSPRSDWERLFSDKIRDDNIQELISEISRFRNKVAHFKFFYSEDYSYLSMKISMLLNYIDRAIEISETEDFNKKNEQSLETIRSGISIVMKKYEEDFRSSFTPLINEMSSYFTETFKTEFIKFDWKKFLGNDFPE
jgi:hypothetical protein